MQPSMNLSFSEAISAWIFLPIALRRSSASNEREAGELLGDRHATAPGRSQMPNVPPSDRLQARIEIGDRLVAVLARGVARDVLHRPRPVEGAERDQVVELGRLHEPQRLAHPRRLELEDAGRLAAREHLVGLRVVERDRRDVETADQLDRLVDHVEVAQAEEVHLQQAERRSTSPIANWVTTSWSAPFCWSGTTFDQRLGADHDAGGVDRVGARQALERPGEVDDLLRDRVGVDRLARARRRASGTPRASGPDLPGSASRSGRRRRRESRARGRRRGRRRGRPSSRR